MRQIPSEYLKEDKPQKDFEMRIYQRQLLLREFCETLSQFNPIETNLNTRI